MRSPTDQNHPLDHKFAQLGNTVRQAPMQRAWTVPGDGQALVGHGPAHQLALGCLKEERDRLPSRGPHLHSLLHYLSCVEEICDERDRVNLRARRERRPIHQARAR